jgi:hypothetical protein
MISNRHLRLGATAGLLVLLPAGAASVARGQGGYVAAIAYSQSTGKIGYTARQARTEESAKQLAARNCGAPDAKVWMWAQDQWVAIAVTDAAVGTAGFGRGATSDEAQLKALAECRKRARGEACRVALCVHSGGQRARTLRSSPRDPSLPPRPAVKTSEFVAAIAYSPSTGKFGSTSGKARTVKEAQTLAAKDCAAADAKVFMWGPAWVAAATADGRTGIAGFGPGATREEAEKAALAQCKKYSRGAPCKIALSIHSAGEPPAPPAPEPTLPAAASRDGAKPGSVTPAAAKQ